MVGRPGYGNTPSAGRSGLSRLVDEAGKRGFLHHRQGGEAESAGDPDRCPAGPVKRRIGAMKGMFTLPDNFEEIDRKLDKEIEKLFLGEDEE
jgi:hypothetical protein